MTPTPDATYQENLAAHLQAYRQRAGITQDEVARALGVSLRTYVEWERGRRLPAVESALLIAELVGCTVEGLLGVGKDS